MYSDLYLRKETPVSDKKLRMVAIFSVALCAVAFFSKQMYQGVAYTEAHSTLTIEKPIVYFSDTSALIQFTLPTPQKAYITYGINEGTYIAYDIRNESEKARKHFLVELRNLTPLTTYTIRVATDEGLVAFTGEAERKMTFTTLSKSQTHTITRPVYGKLVGIDGKGISGGLVVLQSVPNVYGRAAMTITKNSGEWLIPIPWSIGDEDALMISFLTEEGGVSHVQSTLLKSAPLPQSIVLGTDYSFVNDSSAHVLPASTVRGNEPEYVVTMQYPLQGAQIPVGRPLVKGKGIPGTDVNVSFSSVPPVNVHVTVQKDGIWVAPDAVILSPGVYTVTAQLMDNQGIMRSLSRDFRVSKDGESVLGESTTRISTPTAHIESKTPTSTPTPIVRQPTLVPVLQTPANTPIIAVGQTAPGSVHTYIVYGGLICMIGGYIAIRTSRYIPENPSSHDDIGHFE